MRQNFPFNEIILATGNCSEDDFYSPPFFTSSLRGDCKSNRSIK